MHRELEVRITDATGAPHGTTRSPSTSPTWPENPVFAEADYQFDLPENRDGSGTPVAVGTVAATDPDSGAITYAITGGDPDGRFEIDRTGGGIRYVGTGEDFEAPPGAHALQVTATDDGTVAGIRSGPSGGERGDGDGDGDGR